jgi:hypothetical protein
VRRSADPSLGVERIMVATANTVTVIHCGAHAEQIHQLRTAPKGFST